MAATSAGSSGAVIGEKRVIGPVGGDEELLEVPADVAAVALGVGDLGELGVDRVPVVAVDVDLLHQRERDAVGGRAERLDLLGDARLLAAELVAREADDREAPGRRRSSAAPRARCTAA